MAHQHKKATSAIISVDKILSTFVTNASKTIIKSLTGHLMADQHTKASVLAKWSRCPVSCLLRQVSLTMDIFSHSVYKRDTVNSSDSY